MKQILGAVAVGTLWLMTGCAGFFSDPNTSSSTVTNTGDYVYVVDQSENELSEFAVGSGALTTISGSPLALPSGLSAASVAVSRSNAYVFVGGVGAIEVYSVGTGGALTLVSGAGVSVLTSNFVAMDTSPDGQWLLALDSLSDYIRIYGINASTGVLTVETPLAISPNRLNGSALTMTPMSLRISPNGAYVAAALGAGGVVTFTFYTSNGTITEASTGQYSSSYNDNAVSFDTTSSYLWVARQGAAGASVIGTFSVNSSAITTAVGTVATDDAPYGLLVDSTGAYVYSANRSGGDVTGYTTSTGNLTKLTSSPFLSGSLTTALAEDNAHAYVIAASFGGTPDLTLYSFDALTGGKLDAVETVANGSGATGTVALATTH